MLETTKPLYWLRFSEHIPEIHFYRLQNNELTTRKRKRIVKAKNANGNHSHYLPNNNDSHSTINYNQGLLGGFHVKQFLKLAAIGYFIYSVTTDLAIWGLAICYMLGACFTWNIRSSPQMMIASPHHHFKWWLTFSARGRQCESEDYLHLTCK